MEKIERLEKILYDRALYEQAVQKFDDGENELLDASFELGVLVVGGIGCDQDVSKGLKLLNDCGLIKIEEALDGLTVKFDIAEVNECLTDALIRQCTVASESVYRYTTWINRKHSESIINDVIIKVVKLASRCARYRDQTAIELLDRIHENDKLAYLNALKNDKRLYLSGKQKESLNNDSSLDHEEGPITQTVDAETEEMLDYALSCCEDKKFGDACYVLKFLCGDSVSERLDFISRWIS